MKHSSNQLDLFNYQPKPVVIQLPIACWGRTVWIGLADAFVKLLLTRPDEEAKWWRGLDHQAAQELKKHGATDSEIATEIRKARHYVIINLLKANHLRRHG